MSSLHCPQLVTQERSQGRYQNSGPWYSLTLPNLREQHRHGGGNPGCLSPRNLLAWAGGADDREATPGEVAAHPPSKETSVGSFTLSLVLAKTATVLSQTWGLNSMKPEISELELSETYGVISSNSLTHCANKITEPVRDMSKSLNWKGAN